MGNADTKTKIFESLRELAKNSPIDKITVKDIAKHAGITTQTFYNHFPDKYEVVVWAYKNRIEKIYELKSEQELSWRGFLALLVNGYKKNGTFIRNAFRNTHGDDAYILKSSEYLCEAIEKDLLLKKNVDELPLEIIMLIKLYVGGVMNVLAMWVFDTEQISEEKMVEILIDGVPEKIKSFYL